MSMTTFRRCAICSAMCGLLVAITVLYVGCGKKAAETPAGQVADATHAGQDQDGADVDDAHSGWWCAEHGVPEEECSICSSTAAAKFKAKGDWCEEHNRAASQCFLCDPSRAEKFTKLYEAKFGHVPPKPTE